MPRQRLLMPIFHHSYARSNVVFFLPMQDHEVLLFSATKSSLNKKTALYAALLFTP